MAKAPTNSPGKIGKAPNAAYAMCRKQCIYCSSTKTWESVGRHTA